jgi:hypothetical protein
MPLDIPLYIDDTADNSALLVNAWIEHKHYVLIIHCPSLVITRIKVEPTPIREIVGYHISAATLAITRRMAPGVLKHYTISVNPVVIEGATYYKVDRFDASEIPNDGSM